jgi:amino acid transporter
MYTMAKDGLLIKKFSLTHPVHKSPHMALILQTIVGIVIFTVTGWLFGPLNGFLVTGLWTGVGTMIDHILLNTSLPLYFRKVKSLRWTYVVVPAVASAIYLFAIYGSFLSINIYIIIGTIVLVIWLLVGGIIYSYKKGIRIALEEGEEI